MKFRKRILYVQYTNPGGYPPLEHSSRLLARSGWKVLFLGTGSFGSDSLRFEETSGIRVRKLGFQSPGLRQKFQYLFFCLWCLFWAIRFRPAWIYASDILSCPAALLIKFLCGIPIVYHEHDAPALRKHSYFERLQCACRSACARRARVCVIPNAERARIFSAEHGVTNTRVVWNCPAKEEIAAEREPLNGAVTLLYHGSIGADLLPITVIDAIAELPEYVSLLVAGYETSGTQGYLSRLVARAAEKGLANRFRYVGTLPRKELLNLCQTADIGLAMFRAIPSNINISHLAGASNKVFDYLACGLPVIVPNSAEWDEVFVRQGCAVSASSESASNLAAIISGLCSNSAELRAMGERGRQQTKQHWNYERQFQPVLELLEANL